MLDAYFIRTYGLELRINEADQILSLLEKSYTVGLNIPEDLNTQHLRCENEECRMSFQKEVLRRAVRSNKE